MRKDEQSVIIPHYAMDVDRNAVRYLENSASLHHIVWVRGATSPTLKQLSHHLYIIICSIRYVLKTCLEWTLLAL